MASPVYAGVKASCLPERRGLCKEYIKQHGSRLSRDEDPQEEDCALSVRSSCEWGGTQLTNHEYTEHFRNEPPVALNAAPVLHQLALRSLDVVYHIFGVRIDALDLLALLRHHLRQLTEYTSKLLDGRLYRLYRLSSLLDVCVLGLRLFHEQELCV